MDCSLIISYRCIFSCKKCSSFGKMIFFIQAFKVDHNLYKNRKTLKIEAHHSSSFALRGSGGWRDDGDFQCLWQHHLVKKKNWAKSKDTRLKILSDWLTRRGIQKHIIRWKRSYLHFTESVIISTRWGITTAGVARCITSTVSKCQWYLLIV